MQTQTETAGALVAPLFPAVGAALEGVRVQFTQGNGNPPGKLADVELHFTAGPLAGLKLIGFALWQRRSGTGANVTYPARQYVVNGERRSFALLRPRGDGGTTEELSEAIKRAAVAAGLLTE